MYINETLLIIILGFCNVSVVTHPLKGAVEPPDLEIPALTSGGPKVGEAELIELSTGTILKCMKKP